MKLRPGPGLPDYRLSCCCAAEMVRDHLGYAARESFRRWYIEELVGAVRIGMRTEHAGDQELSLGEALAQHAHERDGAAEAGVGGRLPEIVRPGFKEGALEPGREFGSIPSGGPPIRLEADFCAVGRIPFQYALKFFLGGPGIAGRG